MNNVWASLVTALVTALLALLSGSLPATAATNHWFEQFKDDATPDQLLRFLHSMPKGGDLHNHLSGSGHPEWYFDAALAAEERGYRYYTKIQIDDCTFDGGAPAGAPYLLYFHTLDERRWKDLPACLRGEYKPLADLDDKERVAWQQSLVLDKPHEGRDEFFEEHWPRLGALRDNPWLVAEILFKNVEAFGAEGVAYLETQVPFSGFTMPDGEPISPDDVLAIYRERLSRTDAKATGVTVRMQFSVLRFHPEAERLLESTYRLAARHDDVVAVNLVGREDNDKGYPLRFLPTFRELRKQLGGVRLSIHAGEVDEPNSHVRDTLLLGAERIGHGFNLISDPDTMLLMQHGNVMIEINLISNLLLGYVDDYSRHPFPEYLRTGIPVALSTDDRGMWDSTMSDEFFVAVTEFDLSWEEIKQLSRNSLRYAFVEEPLKTELLGHWENRIQLFEQRFRRKGTEMLENARPQYRGFLCRNYSACAPSSD